MTWTRPSDMARAAIRRRDAPAVQHGGGAGCSPRLLEAGPAPRQPRDLAAHTLCYVDCRPGGVVWPNWALWMAAAGVPDFDDSGCVAFTESSHVAQAVMDGGAVGLVERELVARELAEGRLIQLFDVGVAAGGDHAYHLAYRIRRQGAGRSAARLDAGGIGAFRCLEIARGAPPAVHNHAWPARARGRWPSLPSLSQRNRRGPDTLGIVDDPAQRQERRGAGAPLLDMLGAITGLSPPT